MTATRILERHAPAPGDPAPASRKHLHLGEFLIPVSLALWVVGLSRTHVPSVQPYGLITSLPVVYYAGIALLIVSAVIELRHRQLSEWRLAAHAVVLVVMLFGTAPIVYPEGRYAWLYKTIGVVQYINAQGRLNGQIDIYQNWPGFFSLAAWFGKVAGVTNPISYAKWAQLVFELAALPLLYLIYQSLKLPVRQRWVATLLYSASNWIAQDYYSPQALGTLLSLGVMALAMRWFYVAEQHRKPRSDRSPSDRFRSWTFPRELGIRHSVLVSIAMIFVYSVLCMTHQLSPYMVAVQLGSLAIAGLLRPRWLPIALLAIAVGYLLPRYGFVNRHFGLLSSLGSFFNNVRPPQLTVGSTSPSERVIAHCAEALSLGMWCLGLAGAWRRWRAGLPVLGLLLLTFSPILLLALQAYGNEGILRVYLFSLPWTAALAAAALLPLPAVSPGRAGAHRSWRPSRGQGTLRTFAALLVAVGLFFPSFFGGDRYNVMPPAEVTGLTSFLQAAPPGTIYVPIENVPLQDTSNYDLFPLAPIFGPYGVITKGTVGSNIASIILNSALRNTSRAEAAYVLITQSMVNFNRDFDQIPPGTFATLERALAKSPVWLLVLHQGGTYIYELPPDVLPVKGQSGLAPRRSGGLSRGKRTTTRSGRG